MLQARTIWTKPRVLTLRLLHQPTNTKNSEGTHDNIHTICYTMQINLGKEGGDIIEILPVSALWCTYLATQLFPRAVWSMLLKTSNQLHSAYVESWGHLEEVSLPHTSGDAGTTSLDWSELDMTAAQTTSLRPLLLSEEPQLSPACGWSVHTCLLLELEPTPVQTLALDCCLSDTTTFPETFKQQPPALSQHWCPLSHQTWCCPVVKHRLEPPSAKDSTESQFRLSSFLQDGF